MQPNEQGKFCSSCQKSVVDLTILSDQQILDLLASTSKVCGRINQTQLEGINNQVITPSPFSWKKLSIAAAFVGFISLIKAEAKSPIAKPLTEQGPVSVKTPVLLSADTIITYKKIFGKVTEVGDTSGIPGVRIFIKGTNIQTATDTKGKYSLNVPVLNNTVLVASFIGYNYLETKLEISKPSQQYNFTLKASVAMLGEVVVVRRPPFIKRVYYKVTYPVRKLFRKKHKTVAMVSQ